MNMTSLPDWNSGMSVGNSLLDAQHQQLLGLGRQAMELLNAPAVDTARFHLVLNDIADATRRHFDTEEAVLESHQCPVLEEHRAEHDRFLERLTELLFNGTLGVSDRTGLADLVHELVTDHVLQCDVPLKDYMH